MDIRLHLLDLEGGHLEVVDRDLVRRLVAKELTKDFLRPLFVFLTSSSMPPVQAIELGEVNRVSNMRSMITHFNTARISFSSFKERVVLHTNFLGMWLGLMNWAERERVAYIKWSQAPAVALANESKNRREVIREYNCV